MAVRTYTDEALEAAVGVSRSWRGVLRELGLAATSGAAIRSVRRRAERLGLEHRHFTGRRQWLNADLSVAVSSSESWNAVARNLGVAESSWGVLKAHARRLAISTAHLEPNPTAQAGPTPMTPDFGRLPRSGSLLAAAWLTLCGREVSWPLEPSPYDLLVMAGDRVKRVQVKTTRVRAGDSWIVWLSRSRGERIVYDPDEIDEFFVIDGDLSLYLVPVDAVGGLHAITLSMYLEYRIGRVGMFGDELSGFA